VSFPIKNGGSFHSYVKLPEGIPSTSWVLTAPLGAAAPEVGLPRAASRGVPRAESRGRLQPVDSHQLLWLRGSTGDDENMMGSMTNYPLVMTNIAMENGP